MLPAEERYNLTFEPPRPPGPSAGRLAFQYEEPKRAKPDDGPREFTVPYDFDGLVVFRHPRFLQPIMEYAQQTGSKHVEIVGYRGATLLSNGATFVEDAAIARKRAEQVAALLKGAGLANVEYRVRWQDQPEAADGVHDASKRRVMVKVLP